MPSDVCPPPAELSTAPCADPTEALVLSEFRRAAREVPAYGILLEEHGVVAEAIHDLRSFSRHCPLLSRNNTFDRFSIDQLTAGGDLIDVADVLTSSGHGGRFSFGVVTRHQASLNAELIDDALDDAFQVRTRKTLAINCLPMGVGFSSNIMTVATTSVREDMAVALVETFGHRYEQILLVGDPLFMKRLTDHARARCLDWSRRRVSVVLGEEIFGERFRGYLSGCLAVDASRPHDGYIMSSFGVGELGLHLYYETPATIGLRRASLDNPAFARDLLGVRDDDVLPMIFTYNPRRTFIEVLDAGARGYGRMTTSMLDPDRAVPLLRYQTGDVARVLGPAHVEELMHRHGVVVPGELPQALLAFRGRQNEELPNGSHVGFYKDALYADHRAARLLTGAFRVAFAGDECTLHVQLAGSPVSLGTLQEDILRAMPPHVRPDRLVLWAYHEFPFGMGLDYERKFAYYGAAPSDAARSPLASASPECVL